MLAFKRPIPMSYDIGMTILSLVVAIVATSGGLYVISRQSASPLHLVLSGIFMGLGIVAMHYTGMAAMRGHAELSYDPLFVVLSVVIAIGASTAALWLAFRTTGPGNTSSPRSSWVWRFPVCTTRRCERPSLPLTAQSTRPNATQVSIKPIWR